MKDISSERAVPSCLKEQLEGSVVQFSETGPTQRMLVLVKSRISSSTSGKRAKTRTVHLWSRHIYTTSSVTVTYIYYKHCYSAMCLKHIYILEALRRCSVHAHPVLSGSRCRFFCTPRPWGMPRATLCSGKGKSWPLRQQTGSSVRSAVSFIGLFVNLLLVFFPLILNFSVYSCMYFHFIPTGLFLRSLKCYWQKYVRSLVYISSGLTLLPTTAMQNTRLFPSTY